MSQVKFYINQIGRREATTLATATTQKVFGTVTTTAPSMRQGVSINNLDLTADLYITFAPTGTTPTMSSTDNDLIVSARTSRQIMIGPGIELWIRSSSSGSINYTAVELL